MAQLGTCFTLALPKAVSCINNIEEFDEKANIIFTADNQMICVYNVSDQRMVKDWTVSGHSVTSPAVCHGQPTRLSTVLNKTTIRTWTMNDSWIEKGHKTVCPKAVFCLWSPPARPQPFAVFHNGSCASIDNIKTNLVNHQIEVDSTILWQHHMSVQSGDVLVLVYKEKGKNAVTCLTYYWTENTDTVLCSKHLIMTPPLNLPASAKFTACHHASKVYLFVLVQSGILSRTCVLATSGSASYNTELLPTMPELDDHAVLTALDNHQVAIAGILSNNQYGIGVWNTRYGLLHSFLPLRKLKPNSKMHFVGDHLYISGKSGVYGIPCTYKVATLGAALGQVSHKTEEDAPNNDTASVRNIRQCLKTLTNKEETSTLKKFQKSFNQFSSWIQSASNEECLLLGQEVTALVQRLTSEEHFCPGNEVFETLFKSQVVQGNTLKLLVPWLIEKHKKEVIHMALRLCSDIPESTLSQALSYYLRSFPFKDVGHSDNMEMEEENPVPTFVCPLDKADTLYLNRLLCTPYNDVFLVSSLRDLDFQLVLKFLKYLSYLLSETNVNEEHSNEKEMPSFVQVVSWIGLVIDAHFAQMLLATDSKDIILQLHQLVGCQVQFCEHLVSLEGILSQLKKKSLLPLKKKVGQYCIKTLHIF